ncbi:MAG: SIS domain-containing protein [Prolixibacteraceae bacterium]|nr:SIS domain-containing protein [Prolixibacteraceae bacterium]MBT6765217.1 SIS domain-containing protein [Prolixibacteraceae bacterium]MBT6999482.1 SIS domain-containing protein [Prolixibacteraceae bacterium]MBT7395872.1 SIS domain-containing protein [Prolixibacteraceae bacterium]
MENNLHIQQLVKRYSQLAELKNEIERAGKAIIDSYENGGKVLVCGNGGSASDSDHIVGELMKSFEVKRPVNQILKTNLKNVASDRGWYLSEKLQQGLPAISLTAHSALISAVANDIDGDLVFAQQVTGYGNKGDILIGMSTSGNSQNVIDALIVAKAKNLVTIGFTGKTGGKMKEFCDILINVPESRTAFVQELHLPIYHILCLEVENHFF